MIVGEQDRSHWNRKKTAFMDTAASYGRGKAVVVATRMETESGRIVSMLERAEKRGVPRQVLVYLTQLEFVDKCEEKRGK